MEIAIPTSYYEIKIPSIKSTTSPTKELSCIYGYKKDFFDPSNSSPPDDFMKKLMKRMENTKNIRSN